ncbi:calcium channel flower [Ditylenchus destructor]|nr:calcium channel flower [Ditylenchus destructor]
MGQAASSAQTQMQTEHDPNAAFPWWVRYLAKGLGIVGGFVAMFFAVLGFISLTASCIIASFFQLVAGFLIVALEAPFCCAFVDFIEKIAQFSESRAYWQKAAIYSIMGVIPIVFCIEINTLLGGGMIFASGVVYGFMALGKKADRSAMMGFGGQDPAWSPQVNQPGSVSAPKAFNQP